MFWGIAFSIYAIYFLGIIPLKIYHYWTGKETSALKVKIEEFPVVYFSLLDSLRYMVKSTNSFSLFMSFGSLG